VPHCEENKLSGSPYNTISLSSLAQGGRARVIDIPEHPLLYALGLRPGKVVESQGCQLFGGPLMIKVGDRKVAIGKKIANEITVITI
jgi:ferrous iron transport protein A